MIENKKKIETTTLKRIGVAPTDLPETNSKSTRKWKAGSWKTTFGALAYFQGLCTC